MSVAVRLEPSTEPPAVGGPLIDCDVHNMPRSPEDVKRYVPLRWRDAYDRGPHMGHHGGMVIGARPQRHIYRADSVPAAGPAGSDLALMQDQLLDRHDIVRALLVTLENAGYPQYGEAGTAMAAALNDYNAQQWLDRDARLSACITIPVEDGERAAREIERVAADPRFVAVFVPMHTREGLGHPKYWPIYEAASRRGLPIVAHVGFLSGVFSAVGTPTYFVEHHTGYSLPFQAQLVSMVYSGVFRRYPDLQFVFQEGGVSWLPSLLWRMDRSWRLLGEQERTLTERPSLTVRAHVSFTTQPMDETEKPHQLMQLLDHLDMDDRLMFATDYPHWDFDDPERILPASRIGAERRRKIAHVNAERIFPFPA